MTEKIVCDRCQSEALRTEELETETFKTYFVKCTKCANEYAELIRKDEM